MSSNIFVSKLEFRSIDVGSYFAEARPFIARAYQSPTSLSDYHLKEVCKCIVNRACDDTAYYLTAARLCAFIIMKEKDEEKLLMIPRWSFRAAVMETVTFLVDEWFTMRGTDVNQYIAFARFVAHLYNLLLEQNLRPGAIEKSVLLVLSNLVSASSNGKNSEIELFCWILEKCGGSLNQSFSQVHRIELQNIMNECRDVFLDTQQPYLRAKLLRVIEMSACRWTRK